MPLAFEHVDLCDLPEWMHKFLGVCCGNVLVEEPGGGPAMQ